MACENKELMAELSDAQLEQEAKEADLLGRHHFNNRRSPKGMQIQGELQKMDEIYRQI